MDASCENINSETDSVIECKQEKTEESQDDTDTELNSGEMVTYLCSMMHVYLKTGFIVIQFLKPHPRLLNYFL